MITDGPVSQATDPTVSQSRLAPGAAETQSGITVADTVYQGIYVAESQRPSAARPEQFNDVEFGGRIFRARDEVECRGYLDLKHRLETNPEPTDIDARMGVYAEEIDFQVRDALLVMWGKGYRTHSAGFGLASRQEVSGPLSIPEEAFAPLERLGADVAVMGYVEENAQGDPDYEGELLSLPAEYATDYIGANETILFVPQTADIDDMKRTWDAIAAVLPELPDAELPDIDAPWVARIRELAASGTLAQEYLFEKARTYGFDYIPQAAALIQHDNPELWARLAADADEQQRFDTPA